MPARSCQGLTNRSACGISLRPISPVLSDPLQLVRCCVVLQTSLAMTPALVATGRTCYVYSLSHYLHNQVLLRSGSRLACNDTCDYCGGHCGLVCWF
jgi:hypothetical protein